jgi:hypothetical protein
MNGGSGDYGGSGGFYEIFTMPYLCDDCESAVFGGLILNQVPVYAKGGVGSTQGGNGGGIDFNMYYFLGGHGPFSGFPVILTAPATSNLAAIDVSAGTGATGGTGGVLGMVGFGTVVNTGAIYAKGGKGTTTGGSGGAWGGFITSDGKGVYSPKGIGPSEGSAVILLPYFNAENSGAIDVSGGNGGTTGGYGADVSMFAYGGVTDSAAITTAGGIGTTTGGDGGSIYLDSYSWPTVYNLLQLTTKGAAVGGNDGCIVVDEHAVGGSCS